MSKLEKIPCKICIVRAICIPKFYSILEVLYNSYMRYHPNNVSVLKVLKKSLAYHLIYNVYNYCDSIDQYCRKKKYTTIDRYRNDHINIDNQFKIKQVGEFLLNNYLKTKNNE